MAELALLALSLLVVKDISSSGSKTLITFTNGQEGPLDQNRRQYNYYLKLAQESLAKGYPVGVASDEQRSIKELVAADNDFVRSLVDRNDTEIDVWLKGHDGLFSLRRDHADFVRLSGLLTRSMNERKRIWFVTYGSTLSIADVVLDQDLGRGTPNR